MLLLRQLGLRTATIKLSAELLKLTQFQRIPFSSVSSFHHIFVQVISACANTVKKENSDHVIVWKVVGNVANHGQSEILVGFIGRELEYVIGVLQYVRD